MLHLMKKLFEAGLTVFSVSVLHHAVVLLLLTHHCGGQPLVVGPSQPVIVNVGDDVILPCHLEPAVDAIDMTVEWARPELNPRFVHVWHERQDHLVNQHQSYKGRTSVSIESLKHGDISLKLSKVKLSDNGKYRCYIPDLNKDSTVELVVGAASSLVISLAGIDTSSSRVVLQCESKGWYPEPEVFWLDGERKLLSAGPTETVRGPDDLYTVISRVTVEKRHSNNFTCRVQQNHINQTRETHIIVPDEFFMFQSNSGVSINIGLAVSLAVSLAVCILLTFAVVFFVWRQNKRKKTRSCMDRIERGDSNETEMQVAEAAETKSLMKTQRVSKNNKETKCFNDQQQLQQEQQRREESENKVENMKQELENVKQENMKQELENMKQEKRNMKQDLEYVKQENMKQELENVKQENMKIKTQHDELLQLLSELETLKKKLETKKKKELEESQNSQSFFSRVFSTNEPLEKAKKEVETLEKKLQDKQEEFHMKINQQRQHKGKR